MAYLLTFAQAAGRPLTEGGNGVGAAGVMRTVLGLRRKYVVANA